MLFARANVKEKVLEALARAPITILATPAGSGKSRIIDSIFGIHGDIDSHSCVMVRFDERVKDLDSFTRYFAMALDHHMPDDVNPYDFILAAINHLPKGLIIVIDDIHMLNGQGAALKIIADLVHDTGTFKADSGRRWLFGTRNAIELPYILWHANGACVTISGNSDFALTADDFKALTSTAEIRETKRIPQNVRNASIHFSTIRLRNELAPFALTKPVIKQKAPWIRRCDSPHFGEKCLCGLALENLSPDQSCGLAKQTHDVARLLSNLRPEIAEAVLACSLAYDLNADFLVDQIPNIAEAIDVLLRLDLAHINVASGQVRLDAVVHQVLKKILVHAPASVIERASRIACELSFSGADVSRAFKTLALREMWETTEQLLAEFGLALFEKEQVNGIVSGTLSAFPEKTKIESPIISGLLGVVTSRVNYTDVAESNFKCALENESFQGPLRRAIHYRYALEIARRNREDTPEHLRTLLEEVHSEEGLDLPLQALSHSLNAVFESKRHPDISMGHLDRAMSIVAQVDDAFANARVRHDCALALTTLGEYERAINLANESLSISMANDFYDLASRTLSIRQDLAYRYEHNLSLAKHYLEVMSHYAERAGESRMTLLSWLCRYWLFVESGRPHEVQSSHDNIDRYTVPDDFMQDQVQSCIVPGTAMKSAWKGRFLDAINLVRSYAEHEPDLEDRAFRWSELCIYFAAQFALTKDIALKREYVQALHEARKAIRMSHSPLLQEGNIALRVAISLVVMDRATCVRSFISYFDAQVDRDSRAPAMREILARLLEWRGDLGQGRKLGTALRGLFENDLGGIALLIEALPPPLSFQPTAP